ncbi:MAG: hypothetical protein RJA61_95 [Candidatus Parcubacteria bacterium]|jgi:protease-4
MNKKLIFILLFFVIIFGLGFYFLEEDSYGDVASSGEISETCNAVGIELRGTLLTYVSSSGHQSFQDDVVSSEEVVGYLWEAENDDDIKAVIVEVDSAGGAPVAGEEIANMIKEMTKPVIAVIRQQGLSASYWAISSADRIFASRNSDVGSIGVTSSYSENILTDKRYVELSSGKFKDAGDPDKRLTEEEKSIFLRDIKIVHENFIQDVANNRNIPIESVRVFADGSSVLGETAKSLGLIDEIGSLIDVKRYIGDLIGEKADVCWY